MLHPDYALAKTVMRALVAINERIDSMEQHERDSVEYHSLVRSSEHLCRTLAELLKSDILIEEWQFKPAHPNVMHIKS